MTNLRSGYIFVTRPLPAGQVLCEKLTNIDYLTYLLPTIAFEAKIPDAKVVNDLKQQDIFIFTSPEAVRQSGAYLTNIASASLIAIGSGTQQLLADFTSKIIELPRQFNSESVLALPLLQSILGKKICIITGESGRDLMIPTLKERGAIVSTLITYARILPKINPAPVISLLQEKKISLIIGTSFTALHNLKILFHSHWDLLNTLPLLVVSERIKKLARDLGFKTIWVANNASHDEIIAALMRIEKEQQI